MKLLVFAASHRKQSINRQLASIAVGFAKARGATIDFPEYGDFDMPIYDDEMFDKHALPEAAGRFIAALMAADGVILSSPEYNWSFPGSLKNMIDWASVVTPNPFAGKTGLLLSASPSLRGGSHGLIQLKVPLQALGMFVFPRIFSVSRAHEVLVGDGLNDAKLMQELEEMVGEFIAATSVFAGFPQTSAAQ